MGPQFFVDGGFVCTYKGITRLLGRGSVRITPAHAGKRGTLPQGCTSQGDHPRACGEKGYKLIKDKHPRGSPPRVRGKGRAAKSANSIIRITPAHAGKSCTHGKLSALPRDHPRTRGEKSFMMSSASKLSGSPPHTRGKASGQPSRNQA